KIEFGPGPGQVFHQMLVGLYLGIKIAPEGGDHHVGAYLFQDLIDIVGLQIVTEELSVGTKGPIGEVGAVGVKIGAELPVYGISHNSTPTQYQYPLFLQMLPRWFIKWQFYHLGRNFVDPDLDKNGSVQGGIFRGHIAQA